MVCFYEVYGELAHLYAGIMGIMVRCTWQWVWIRASTHGYTGVSVCLGCKAVGAKFMVLM